TFTTDILGSITLPNVITAGTYTVYEGTKPLKTFTVKDECQVIVKPSSGGGGWTPPPVDPDPKPPVEPEKPDPEKPDPGKPDPEKPDPGKPDPEKPDPGKPDPEKPDPEKPDPGKPNPEPPVDPGKPNPEKPDPGKPVDPGKPNPEKPGKPTVDDVIEDGKKLPPYNSSRPDKDTLDKYKDFQNKYNKLSEDEKLLVRQKVNVDKIFAAIEEMEALLAKGKLPQTDGANQSGLTLAGLLLVAGSLFFLRRRNAEVK
ncbi:MAG: LPXTG cell wall anchor domain-containing protein, partial [Lysinibacillus sp.]